MNHPIQLKNRSNRLDVAWTRNSRVKETRACRGKSTPRGNILPSGPVDIRQGRATEEVGAVLPPCVPHEWRGRSWRNGRMAPKPRNGQRLGYVGPVFGLLRVRSSLNWSMDLGQVRSHVDPTTDWIQANRYRSPVVPNLKVPRIWVPEAVETQWLKPC